jgi:acyl-CoA synthetase (AMP-forming)/AMP-acid ligase II
VKGDRVAIAMRNIPEWPVAFFAASLIGAIVVPLNAWWSGAELAFGLRGFRQQSWPFSTSSDWPGSPIIATPSPTSNRCWSAGAIPRTRTPASP